MASRLLADLTPDTRDHALRWLAACRDAGTRPLIYCTFRPAVEQAALYWQGRSRPTVEAKAQRMREAGYERLARMLLEAEGQRPIGGIVTRSGPGESWHQYGLAWDAVPLDGRGVAAWNDTAGYAAMGLIAADLGIEWGGSWTRFVDRPHFQVTAGRTLSDAMRDLDLTLGDSSFVAARS